VRLADVTDVSEKFEQGVFVFEFAGIDTPHAAAVDQQHLVGVRADALPIVRNHEERRAGFVAVFLDEVEEVAFARDIRLQSHPVSRRVNRVRNNDSKLVDEVAPATDDQMMLF